MIGRLISFFKKFRRVAPSEEEVRPNRAARRLALRMKPGEQRARLEASALAKAKRKKARGYRGSHVRTREIYKAGVERGIDMTLRALKKTLRGQQKRKWLPRINSRLAAA